MEKKGFNCPSCKSEKIISGKCLGQLDLDPMGIGHIFRPDGLKILAISSTDMRVSNKYTACLDCGLLWNRLNQKKLKELISKIGNKKTNQRLEL